mmetsp:Transcript_88732/g.259327  ORF Transcript_88732/g.259327 Transcript_88732/m.259327 type:complete len:306 (-) Transcript_88732:553-1470(-)
MCNSVCSKVVLKPLHKEVEFRLVCFLRHPQEHGAACHHCSLQVRPHGFQVLGQERLDLVHSNRMAPSQLHDDGHLLQDPPALDQPLLLLEPLGLVTALHPLQHHIQRDPVHHSDRGLALVVLFCSASLCILPFSHILLHRLQVAEEHAQHHRIAKDILFAFAKFLILMLLAGAFALAVLQLLEEPVESVDALQAKSGMRNLPFVLVEEIAEPHHGQKLAHFLEHGLPSEDRPRGDHYKVPVQDEVPDARFNDRCQPFTILKTLKEEEHTLHLYGLYHHPVPQAVLAPRDPQVLVEPIVDDRVVEA